MCQAFGITPSRTCSVFKSREIFSCRGLGVGARVAWYSILLVITANAFIEYSALAERRGA
jgi:hypothetical protein